MSLQVSLVEWRLGYESRALTSSALALPMTSERAKGMSRSETSRDRPLAAILLLFSKLKITLKRKTPNPRVARIA